MAGFTMRTLVNAAIVLTAALLCTCNRDRQPTTPDSAHIAKIKVNRDGIIRLDDQPVTIDALRASLLKLSQSADAAVWYYRENSAGEPHPNAVLVLQAIVDSRLPVKLSTRPDFSDSVGPGGASNPPR
jgi:hypothetical protein